MSPFWTLLELRMMEMVVSTGVIRRAKLQSTFDRPDALPVTKPTVTKH